MLFATLMKMFDCRNNTSQIVRLFEIEYNQEYRTMRKTLGRQPTEQEAMIAMAQ